VKGPLFLIFALGISAAAAAVDFGLVTNFDLSYDTGTGNGVFSFERSHVPWFSASITEKIGLYISARLGFEDGYKSGRWDHDVFFELDRTELNIRLADPVYLTFGRQRYRDSAGIIASGLFDGFYGTFGTGGRFRLTGGLFSTALLRKETAEIRMTEKDRKIYEDPGRYLGSNRMFAVLGGEFPDLTSRTSLMVSALAQFDMNGYGTSALHNQYLTALYRIDGLDTLRFVMFGIMGVIESNREIRANFAGGLGMDWDVPGNLADMLTGECYWRSGEVNKGIGPFIPITGLTRGSVFNLPLPGLMDARVSYTARPRRTFSFNAVSAVFFRTDLETFGDAELDLESKERYLGVECYGQITWAPQSPLRMTLGGGVFLPGDAFVEGTDPRWKIDTGLIFSL
jgi:hypothetical protein